MNFRNGAVYLVTENIDEVGGSLGSSGEVPAIDGMLVAVGGILVAVAGILVALRGMLVAVARLAGGTSLAAFSLLLYNNVPMIPKMTSAKIVRKHPRTVFRMIRIRLFASLSKSMRSAAPAIANLYHIAKL